MKNSINISLLFILLLGMVTAINAQERKLAKAEKSYGHLDYVDAQKIYLAVAEKGFESEELFTKLANTYYFNAQYDEAAKWYGNLFRLNPESENAIAFLRYSQALQAIGNTAMAEQYYNQYAAKIGQPMAKTSVDYAALIEQNSGRYELQSLEKIYDINKISFGHTKVGNKLVFASTKNTQTFLNRRSAWDGLSFLSLYEVELDGENRAIGSIKKLKGEWDSKFHESSPVFTRDGNTMYFTRSNLTYGDKRNDQKLKIYRTIKVDGKWQEAEDLNINSDLYSSAHPALSADETKLYFSSDRPGGFGESDLYVSEIQQDGTLGYPVNLGPAINTAGKETFPFVSIENELYFSSDGHFGLGSLDVFYVKIKDNGYGNLLNVGAPVNSYADDFAFGIDSATKRGFISSNRSSTQGEFVYDNIYSFLETAPIKDLLLATIDGHVTDRHTGEPIANATVTLTDARGNIFAVLHTDNRGYYQAETSITASYSIRVEKEDYVTDEKQSQANLESQTIDFQLQQNKIPLETGIDLAKVLNIPMIYFDFDKSNIRPDAQVELEKVLAALNEYPQLRLAIRSHTDSRGSDVYNQGLSQRRAQATLDYLVKNGIDKTRLTAEGLGETELVNHCSNGVPCSAEEHQKNRRSEFIVLD